MVLPWASLPPHDPCLHWESAGVYATYLSSSMFLFVRVRVRARVRVRVRVCVCVFLCCSTRRRMMVLGKGEGGKKRGKGILRKGGDVA